MKLSLLAGVALASMLLAAPEASASGYKPYVSVFGGAAVLTKNPHITSTGFNTYDLLMNNPGYIIGGAVGVDWGNQIRTELELSHARWNSDKYHVYCDCEGSVYNGNSSMSATYLLGNVWYDLSHSSRVTPYVGGGLGIGWANVHAGIDGGPVDFNASGLAFQVGAGIRFNVNDHVSFDAGYRFKDIVGLNYSSNVPEYTLTDTSLASHNFQIGLTYQF